MRREYRLWCRREDCVRKPALAKGGDAVSDPLYPDRVRRYAKRLNMPCGEFIHLDGEWNHYLVSPGQGRPVVLLHGLMAWGISWEPVLDSLAGRPYYVPDLRGFGWSEKTNQGTYDLTSQAQRVLRLLEAWGLDEVTLMGHSMGGEIALRVALLAPERVRSLVLCDSACYVSGRGAAVERMLRLPPWLAHLLLRGTAFSWRYADRAMQNIYYNPARIAGRMVRAYHAPSRLPGVAPTLRAVLRDMDFGAWQERYAEITQPTRMIWGEHDTITPLAHGQRLAQTLPHAELHIIPEAHHVPQEERPELVAPLLQEWLSQPDR